MFLLIHAYKYHVVMMVIYTKWAIIQGFGGELKCDSSQLLCRAAFSAAYSHTMCGIIRCDRHSIDGPFLLKLLVTVKIIHDFV